jgi:hypothetical protein
MQRGNGKATVPTIYVHSMSRLRSTPSAVASGPSSVITRRSHYASFFGEAPLPDGFGLVVGNCQAESLRIVVDGPESATVRVPPVHEMDGVEAVRLRELVARADFVVTQPIRDDYRALPLGTRQLASIVRRGARFVTVPSIRFGGLHPFQAALRVAGIDEDPPIVAYHDIRTLAQAAGLALPSALSTNGVRAVADQSIVELRRRERDIDVPASDLLTRPSGEHMRTVNHPGNPVWMALAERVITLLGSSGTPSDPDRPLLNAVRAPLESEVVLAWGLDDEPTSHWTVDGEVVEGDRISDAHREWYARHPHFVRAALDRLRPLVHTWRAA